MKGYVLYSMKLHLAHGFMWEHKVMGDGPNEGVTASTRWFIEDDGDD